MTEKSLSKGFTFSLYLQLSTQLFVWPIVSAEKLFVESVIELDDTSKK